MPRPILPHALAILQLTFRVLTLAAEHGCFITTLYVSLNFQRTNPMLYVALLWFIIVDNSEILALTARPGDGLKRFGLCVLVTLEVLGLSFFLISFFVAFMGPSGLTKRDEADELGVSKGEEGANYMIAQWFLVFSIVGLHMLMMIINGIDVWLYRRTMPRTRLRREWVREQRREQALMLLGQNRSFPSNVVPNS